MAADSDFRRRKGSVSSVATVKIARKPPNVSEIRDKLSKTVTILGVGYRTGGHFPERCKMNDIDALCLASTQLIDDDINGIDHAFEIPLKLPI